MAPITSTKMPTTLNDRRGRSCRPPVEPCRAGPGRSATGRPDGGRPGPACEGPGRVGPECPGAGRISMPSAFRRRSNLDGPRSIRSDAAISTVGSGSIVLGDAEAGSAEVAGAKADGAEVGGAEVDGAADRVRDWRALRGVGAGAAGG